jgi:hypothetical protein
MRTFPGRFFGLAILLLALTGCDQGYELASGLLDTHYDVEDHKAFVLVEGEDAVLAMARFPNGEESDMVMDLVDGPPQTVGTLAGGTITFGSQEASVTFGFARVDRDVEIEFLDKDDESLGEYGFYYHCESSDSCVWNHTATNGVPVEVEQDDGEEGEEDPEA